MPTVFLDRDGVINRNRPRGDYVKSWHEFQFLPGARGAIARLTQAGFQLIVITNQACVGRGIVPWDELQHIHELMMKEIAYSGGRIEAVLCCPHVADEGCHCRKPAPGLLKQAQEEYKVDLRHAIVVGDSLVDIQAAAAVGIPAIMLLSGLGRIPDLERASVTCRLGLNLAHAAQLILNDRSQSSDDAIRLRGAHQRFECGHRVGGELETARRR
jgi:histidinol-phosphate phosphatase family protein